MKQHLLLSSLFSMSLLMQAHAVAPVVDDSDNFAMLNNETMPEIRSSQHDTDQPLAQIIPEDKTQDRSVSEQLHTLQQEVQTLRGELEVQAHHIEQMKLDMTRFYKDLEAQCRQHNNTPPVHQAVQVESVSPLPISTKASGNPADEQVQYLSAYDLVKSKRYDEALLAMQTFVSQYPQGGYSANAEYWIGELYLVKQQPQEAIPHFEKVLHQFPTSSKAAASALKIGYALAAMGQKEKAKIQLQEVIKSYPDTTASQLAKARLSAL